ncbi:MAG: GNAT family N-acetyltransferase [Acidimicrobiales bacterium]
MLELVAPDVALYSSWLASHREWGPGEHEDGFGLGADDDVETPEGFSAWVSRLGSLPTARLWWIVQDNAVLGGVALRAGTTERVLRLGHVGYGVRPSARGRGIATWAMGELLVRARAQGMTRLLVVCLDDNVGSIKVIERHAGVLEGVRREAHGLVRRYWIDL